MLYFSSLTQMDAFYILHKLEILTHPKVLTNNLRDKLYHTFTFLILFIYNIQYSKLKNKKIFNNFFIVYHGKQRKCFKFSTQILYVQLLNKLKVN